MNPTATKPSPKPSLADLYRTDPLKACRAALRRTRQLPEQDRLEEIDRLLGNFGVEAIRGEWQNGYWCDIAATYSNTGDAYDLTVLHVRGPYSFSRGRFVISSWADWVEQNEKRLAIQ